MLQRLYIENYALIEHLDLSFQTGLTVITGETGAGKSILLGALALILGQRADSKVILEGKDRCVVEVEFHLTGNEWDELFQRYDLVQIPDTCILRREIYAGGKSRAFVNDSPVALGILKELSPKLIDIHSQHQNLLLGSGLFQLQLLDALASNNRLLETYKQAYAALLESRTALQALQRETERAKEEEDFIRFQYDQLEAAELKAGELSELEHEWTVLSHAEEILSGLAGISTLLDGEDQGALMHIRNAQTTATQVSSVYPELDELKQRLQSVYIEMKDIVAEVQQKSSEIELDPGRMQFVGERIDQLYGLLKKHHVSDDVALIALRDQLDERLQQIGVSDTALENAVRSLKAAEQEADRLAVELSVRRKAICDRLEKRLVEELMQLGMPKTQLRFNLETKPLDVHGMDRVNLMFRANSSGSLRPVQDVASGGEMSRIMLVIKSILAESMQLSTLLFDEIDTGVSGEVADKMAGIMRAMGAHRQIICITHLPQIAAKGNHHLKVYKKEMEGRTRTSVTTLNQEMRLQELAQMLSGAHISEAALLNAGTLLADNQSTTKHAK